MRRNNQTCKLIKMMLKRKQPQKKRKSLEEKRKKTRKVQSKNIKPFLKLSVTLMKNFFKSKGQRHLKIILISRLTKLRL